MSWGASLLKLPADTKLEDLPSNYQTATIGTPEHIAVLTALFPHQQHHTGQTTCSNEIFWVEFLYDTSDFVPSIEVRSKAQAGALNAMKIVCDALKLTMVDHQCGEIVDFSTETGDKMNKYRAWSQGALQSP